MRTIRSIQGERWDQLCMRVYGVSNEQAVLSLRHANALLVRTAHPFLLPQGALVSIPELPLETLRADEVVEVAPWQR